MKIPHAVTVLLWVLISGLSIFLMLPDRPLEVVPPNLDGSWRLALTIAFARGLVFGHDFIFTYGPLGFLAARAFSEGTRWYILAYDLLIALQLPLVCFSIYRRSRSLLTLLSLSGVFFILGAASYAHDPAILLFVLSTFWLFDGRTSPSRFKFLLCIVNALLSFYVKVNLGLAAIGQIFAFLILDLLRGHNRRGDLIRLAAVTILLLLSSLPLNVRLIPYIIGSLHIANGFNDAMYLDVIKPEYLEWALIMLGALGLTLVPALIASRQLLLVLSCAGFSFLLFKQGFVRGDEHIYVFFDYLVIPFGMLALFCSAWVQRYCTVMLAAAIGISIWQNNMPWQKLPLEAALEKYSHLEKYAGSFTEPIRPASSTNPALPAEFIKLIGSDTVDIIPDDSALLTYAGLTYLPRPALQSYTSYDRYLDQSNARHLRENGPLWVIFSPGCIDDRHCLHDDTELKLTLLQYYDAVETRDSFTLLRRRDTPRTMTRTLAKSGTMRLGERLPFKEKDTLLVIEFDIDYSASGKLRRFAYKPSSLRITLSSNDKKQSYRAILPIMRGGIIANKALISKGSSEALMQHQFNQMDSVSFLRLHSNHSNHFSKYFTYRIYRIEYH